MQAGEPGSGDPQHTGRGPADELFAIEHEYAVVGVYPGSEAWALAIEPMMRLLAASQDAAGARTLADALDLDLGSLADALDLRPAFESLMLKALTRDLRLTDEFLSRLTQVADAMSPAEHLIGEERLFASTPMTLQELGDELGVTRERVRQVEARLKGKLNRDLRLALQVVATVMRQQLGPVIAEAELLRRTRDLFKRQATTHVDLARQMLLSEMGYSCEQGTCFDDVARDLVRRLTEAADSLSDDVGLINEPGLQSRLPNDSWLAHWPALVERSGFYRLSGQLALRNTQKAAVKAALISIGQPASRDEVAALAAVQPTAAGSQLSNIPSVTRTDKVRWALAEWIDEEYGGISSEIVQRIEADGGSTSLQRLLNELPRRFGVSETSVRAYAHAPQFDVEGGFVRMADEKSLTLRDLDEIIDSRDETGAPYWSFIVQERYFAGYSLLGVPPEFAVELGCSPNGHTTATLLHPSGCRDLSVIWRLTSLTGASIGYLAEPLDRLGVAPGNRVRIVLRGPGAVELHREEGNG